MTLGRHQPVPITAQQRLRRQMSVLFAKHCVRYDTGGAPNKTCCMLQARRTLRPDLATYMFSSRRSVNCIGRRPSFIILRGS